MNIIKLFITSLIVVSCGVDQAEIDKLTKEQPVTEEEGADTTSKDKKPTIEEYDGLTVEVSVKTKKTNTCPVQSVGNIIDLLGLPNRVVDSPAGVTLVYPTLDSLECRRNPATCNRRELCNNTDTWEACSVGLTRDNERLILDMVNIDSEIEEYFEGCK